ncbi:hypothetical protein T261_02002 [Streptomyces lydicus]|nr:hypothetical protein T261_02002 [Streptomyces lydicus]
MRSGKFEVEQRDDPSGRSGPGFALNAREREEVWSQPETTEVKLMIFWMRATPVATTVISSHLPVSPRLGTAAASRHPERRRA